MTHRLHIVNCTGYIAKGDIHFLNINKEIIDSFSFTNNLEETKTVDIPKDAVLYNIIARSTTNEDNT